MLQNVPHRYDVVATGRNPSAIVDITRDSEGLALLFRRISFEDKITALAEEGFKVPSAAPDIERAAIGMPSLVNRDVLADRCLELRAALFLPPRVFGAWDALVSALGPLCAETDPSAAFCGFC